MKKEFPHLLFICPTVAGYIGGTETVVSQFCQRLRHQAQITLLSGEPGPGRKRLVDIEGVELITLPFIAREVFPDGLDGEQFFVCGHLAERKFQRLHG